MTITKSSWETLSSATAPFLHSSALCLSLHTEYVA